MALSRLLQLAFALALVVVMASSTLRLAANGIGCEPWPSCYGLAATAEAANAAPLALALRVAHRIAASAFALAALAAVWVGWKQWGRPARTAGVLLLAVTIVLAWIGRYTPSPLPAVTLVNVLGGFALLALLAYLMRSTLVAPIAGNTAATAGLVALFVALALQAGGGALISARLAGDACASNCNQLWPPGAAALFDPLQAGRAAQLASAQAGQALHLLHRLGGLALMLATIVGGFALHRRAPRAAVAVMSAAATAGGLGFLVASFEPPLAAAALHAFAAGLLCASLGAACALRGGPLQEK